MNSPLAASIPARNAAALPPCGIVSKQTRSRSAAKLRTTSADESSLPSSTTRSSKAYSRDDRYSQAVQRVRGRFLASLYAGITSDKNGAALQSVVAPICSLTRKYFLNLAGQAVVILRSPDSITEA